MQMAHLGLLIEAKPLNCSAKLPQSITSWICIVWQFR